MASIVKRNGKWRAYIRIKGVSKSATFANKTDAQHWATQIESDIIQKRLKPSSYYTVKDLFERYEKFLQDKHGDKIHEHRNTAKVFINKLGVIKREPFVNKKVGDLTKQELIEWIEKRLKEVKPNTVRREISALSVVLNKAMNDWEVVHENICKRLPKVKEPRPRDRRITQEEIDAVIKCSGYDHGVIDTTAKLMTAMFLFAIETAMRQGEIAKLTWDNVDLENRTAHLPMTKNGEPRDVPLSLEAVRILKQLPRINERCFNKKLTSFSTWFAKLFRRAGVKNLHFHDTRHEAITRLSKKLNVLELARMVGHKNLKMLMVYYNESAADIAKKL